MCRLQCRCIVCAVAGYGNHVAFALQTFHKILFVEGLGT